MFSYIIFITDTNLSYETWDSMANNTEEKFSLGLHIVNQLFPGHQKVFLWLLTQTPDKMIDKEIWVRVCVTYVINHGSMRDLVSVVYSLSKNEHSLEVSEFSLLKLVHAFLHNN